ncbi:class I SAM-dependent methyltransferase [Streptomyces iconiensis]|uniref:Class I SAM-dependent methyltransferase n=1 Tax=Streptomyces iconiensis TaxID=1384038 RepID=A0ABT7A6B7_9ACTN|nr:class I SAM-dependent methyltransferase [Streptomyces iconiensis]MDJ1136882.1 class I SAM-dependent methyltransferase [Streptomyces iconiensis]
MLFGQDHADIYDLVYQGRGKDYAQEADDLARLIKERRPDAASLLDVACGTGEHLASLRKWFERVEGVELAEAMVTAAQAKLKDVTVTQADMRDFQLGRTFDVVTCLYSSIAYLDEAGLSRAVAAMTAHLAPGGLLVIEPWWRPEKAIDNRGTSDILNGENVTVARVSHGVIRDGAHHLQCQFLVADADGIRHFTDTQVLSLFSVETYLAAMRDTGLTAEFMEGGPSGRGLYVGAKN